MKTLPLQKEIISKNEAAFILGCRPETIAILCEVGLLTCRSNGKVHKINRQEVRNLIDTIWNPKNPTSSWCKIPKQKIVLDQHFYNKMNLSVPNDYTRN